MKAWLAVEARFDLAPADWSLFVDAFTRHGCSSSLQSDGPPRLTGFLEDVAGSNMRAEALAQELRSLGAVAVQITSQPDEDWAEIWKQHFKPRRIGSRFVVVPSWESYDGGPEDVLLHLDPGQAFGTGEHPTTELCLRLLEEENLADRSVLDLGCGSGILAIAAAQLGARSVTATDIEASAVEIARENARLNGVEVEFYAGDGFADWSGERRWDLVVSNIISATLIRLASSAAQHVHPKGTWIVSGVLGQNWPDVRAEAERWGFVLSSMQEQDDWIGATFRRAE